MLVQEALGLFVTQLEADGRSPHTIGQYRRHVGALIAWAGPGRDLADIGHEQVARFLAAPAARTRPDGGIKKAASMNAMRSSVGQFIRYAHEAGWIASNPTRLIRRAITGRPLPRALADGEGARLLAAITDARDHALFTLLLGTGIRIGSALALDAADVDFERHEVLLRRAKGDRVERVYLPKAVAEVLANHLAGRREGRVFMGIGARHAHRRLAHWLGVAGIARTASPHALRHTFATSLLRKTGDILLVQKALHHRNIESTLRYAALDDARVRAAIEA